MNALLNFKQSAYEGAHNKSIAYHDSLINLKNDNAKLVAEIDRLTSELEDTTYEKGRTSTKVKSLQATISNYKDKSKDLIETLDILERNCSKYHNESYHYREKLEKSTLAVRDLQEIKNALQAELEEQKKIIEKIEKERNIALESAEAIQSSLIDFKNQASVKINQLESRIAEISSEKQSYVARSDETKTELVKLQVQLKNSSRDLQQERNLIKRLESQQRDYFTQSRSKAEQVKKLEQDLAKFDAVKSENKRVNGYCSELKKKIEKLEDEVELAKNQLEKFEVFVQKLRQNGTSKSVAKFAEYKKTLSWYDQKACNGEISKALSDLGVWFDDIMTERKWQAELIGSLESTISQLQVEKTSLESQLGQKVMHLSDLNKELQDKMANDCNLEKELRKKSLQINVLESQLEDNMKISLASAAKCQRTEAELMESMKRREVLESELKDSKSQLERNNASLEASDSKQAELREALEAVTSKHDACSQDLLKAEKRCASLQENLNKIIRTMNSLKDEVQESDNRNQDALESLEKELRGKNRLCDELKTRLSEVQTVHLNCTKESERVLRHHRTELESKNKVIDSLKGNLERAVCVSIDKDEEIANFGKVIEEKDAVIRENVKRIENFEEAGKAMEKELAEMQMNRFEEINILKKELQSLNEELNSARSQSESSQAEIVELKERERNLASERKKVVEEFGFDAERALKELKEEKKQNEKKLHQLECARTEKAEVIRLLEKYKIACKELKSDYSKLKAALDREKKNARALSEKNERLSSEVKTSNDRLSGSLKQLGESNGELENLRKELRESKLAAERDGYEIDQYEIRVGKLEEVLESQSWQLQEQNIRLAEMNSSAKQQCSDVQQKLIEMEAQLSDQKHELSARESLIKQLSEQMEQLSLSLKESLASRQVIEGDYNYLKSESRTLKSTNEKFETALKTLTLENQSLKISLSKATEHVGQCREKLESCQKECSEANRELISVKHEKQMIASDLLEKMSTLRSSELKVKELTELSESLERVKSEKNEKSLMVEHDLRLQLDKLKAETLELRQRKNDKDQEIDVLKNKLKFCENQYHKLMLEVMQANKDLWNAKNKLKVNPFDPSRFDEMKGTELETRFEKANGHPVRKVLSLDDFRNPNDDSLSDGNASLASHAAFDAPNFNVMFRFESAPRKNENDANTPLAQRTSQSSESLKKKMPGEILKHSSQNLISTEKLLGDGNKQKADDNGNAKTSKSSQKLIPVETSNDGKKSFKATSQMPKWK